jgi:tripartite-type tricarboxylate transporter receptor subunit TctC
VTVFNYIAVRAGTPQPLVARLSREVQAAMRDPAVLARNAPLGVAPMGSSPEETERILREEAVKWREVIRNAGIRLD